MSIADNVKFVQEKVAAAAIKAGRNPEEISLVAATKMNSADRVREAIAAGIKICGENRVQELVEKNAQNAYEGSSLHFIGHLQKNKVRNLVGVVDLIQSAGSRELIEAIDKRAVNYGFIQDILIEVNIGREEAKSGIMAEELDETIAYASTLSGVRVKGLMAIPPISLKPSETVYYFDLMRKLFVDIGAKKYDNVIMQTLSMGMSHDYAEAIMSGANMVRVGTAIFGERHY